MLKLEMRICKEKLVKTALLLVLTLIIILFLLHNLCIDMEILEISCHFVKIMNNGKLYVC